MTWYTFARWTFMRGPLITLLKWVGCTGLCGISLSFSFSSSCSPILRTVLWGQYISYHLVSSFWWQVNFSSLRDASWSKRPSVSNLYLNRVLLFWCLMDCISIGCSFKQPLYTISTAGWVMAHFLQRRNTGIYIRPRGLHS